MEELRFQEYLDATDEARYEEVISTLETMDWNSFTDVEGNIIDTVGI